MMRAKTLPKASHGCLQRLGKPMSASLLQACLSIKVSALLFGPYVLSYGRTLASVIKVKSDVLDCLCRVDTLSHLMAQQEHRQYT